MLNVFSTGLARGLSAACLVASQQKHERENGGVTIFDRSLFDTLSVCLTPTRTASGAPDGRGTTVHSPPRNLPVDERPIVSRERAQGREIRAGISPDDRFVEGSGRYGDGGFDGRDDTQVSPPKTKPRILHSGEGPRSYTSREE